MITKTFSWTVQDKYSLSEPYSYKQKIGFINIGGFCDKVGLY